MSSPRKPKHENPFNILTPHHAEFERQYSKKTAWGNFKGMFPGGTKARVDRVAARVTAQLGFIEIGTSSRSNSFRGHVHETMNGSHVYADFLYSARKNEVEVKTIMSDVPGGGTRMMARIEDTARRAGAERMMTATSRPGFFKKMDFDYTSGQRELNNVKYSQAELEDQETNKNATGGAFIMEKRF